MHSNLLHGSICIKVGFKFNFVTGKDMSTYTQLLFNMIIIKNIYLKLRKLFAV